MVVRATSVNWPRVVGWGLAGLAIVLAGTALHRELPGPVQVPAPPFAEWQAASGRVREPLTPGFHERSLVVRGLALRYQLFVPAGYRPDHPVPVVLFAHGSAEEGEDNRRQVASALGAYLSLHATTFPAAVVLPQVPQRGLFPHGREGLRYVHELFLVALDSTMRQINGDPKRLYMTGISAGGFRTWGLAFDYPMLFAAIAPISGGVAREEEGGMTMAQAASRTATKLRNLPIWMWHGDADAVIPFREYAEPIRAAFAELGSPATFHLVVGKGRGHELQVNYNDPAFWAWLFAQHR